MKFLKKVLILFVALIGLVLIIALFVKKDYHVFRTVEVEMAKDDVFEYVRMIKNQENFSVWQNMDPKVKQTYTGTDGMVGSIYAWDSKVEDVGVGEQEITKIDVGNRVDFELRFLKPMEMTGNSYFTTEEAGGKTKVTWGFTGESPWPWNFFFLFINMDEELGPDLQKGLDNLKLVLESEKEQ